MTEDEPDQAKKAHDEALGKLQRALDGRDEVREVAEVTRGWRDRNHFADLLIAAMEANR